MRTPSQATYCKEKTVESRDLKLLQDLWQDALVGADALYEDVKSITFVGGNTAYLVFEGEDQMAEVQVSDEAAMTAHFIAQQYGVSKVRMNRGVTLPYSVANARQYTGIPLDRVVNKNTTVAFETQDRVFPWEDLVLTRALGYRDCKVADYSAQLTHIRNTDIVFFTDGTVLAVAYSPNGHHMVEGVMKVTNGYQSAIITRNNATPATMNALEEALITTLQNGKEQVMVGGCGYSPALHGNGFTYRLQTKDVDSGNHSLLAAVRQAGLRPYVNNYLLLTRPF
jgi:hypothetical protein